MASDMGHPLAVKLLGGYQTCHGQVQAGVHLKLIAWDNPRLDLSQPHLEG